MALWILPPLSLSDHPLPFSHLCPIMCELGRRFASCLHILWQAFGLIHNASYGS